MHNLHEVKVASKGFYDYYPTYAYFYVNNSLVVSGFDGWSVVKWDPLSTTFVPLLIGANMDVDGPGANSAVYNALIELAIGDVFLIGIQDTPSANGYPNSDLMQLLQELGSTASVYPYRYSYTLIALQTLLYTYWPKSKQRGGNVSV